jgi:hypothetical protein
MTFREKVDYLIADLRGKGVSAYTTAPPLFRLFWALGINIPPPFFLGFLTLTLSIGSFFVIVWGILMWLQWWVWQNPVAMAVAVSVAAGLAFGMGVAAYYRWKAARLGLPRLWEEYGPEDVEEEDV